ncbi:hypothetical protein BWZ22_06280 [Seonamhaeicola sp. S2-3]|uniref:lipocalin family protein n=1 Tax=Seonamhaeicola sp. S2-3 TaxID=1936081 RepID=UPI0009728684|nr:lipocalin family protein [Seonamhaeicola sp. S2-3]APY10868.1 hypothetical protein BWZ22_06280 [Seonamhaeicola sp. S2-3]
MKTLIKNYKLLFVLVLLTSFFSCSSDDDATEPTTAELLAHKWFIVKQVDNSTTPVTEFIADECEQNIYYNFYNDGTLVAESFGFNGTDCESTGIEVVTYVLSDDENQILLTSEGSTNATNIITLTKTELVIGSNNYELHFKR